MLFLRLSLNSLILGFLCSPLTAENNPGVPRFDSAAQYFRPAWTHSDKDTLPEIPKELVLDPNQRLPEILQVPPLMRGRVYFWMQIYGRFSSWMRVLHDREEPSLIYGYVDCSSIHDKKKTRMQREIACTAVEKSAVRRMRRLLTRLDRNPTLKAYILSHGILETDFNKLSRRLRSQTGQKDIYLLALQRAQNLIPVMEDKLENHAIPSHMSRIPFVESSFHPKATSKVKAIGIWQFMPKTAKAFIHRSDKRQWADPILQTEGAALMLKQNQRALGDWGLTVTSYNSGVGRISRLSKKYQLKNIQELLFLPEPSKRLGFAGKNFYAEFLAANILYNYQRDAFYSEILSGPIQTLLPIPDPSCSATKKTYTLY